MMTQVQSPALPSGLRIRHCCELWYRSQTRLGAQVAVAVAQAGGFSSNWTPSLGTSICLRCSPNKTEKKKKKNLIFEDFVKNTKKFSKHLVK